MWIAFIQNLLGITELKETLMAFVDEIKAALADFKSFQDAKFTEFETELAEVLSRESISVEDKDAILALVADAKTKMGSFDVIPETPAPAPEV